MANKKLTDLNLITTIENEDVLHIVDMSDTTQDLEGSSFKVTAQKIKEFAQDGIVTEINWGDIEGTLSNQTDLNTALNLKSDAITVSNHISDTTNPHSVTKAQVGLGNADNTSDLNKPISTATQTALNTKLESSDIANFETTTQLNTRDINNRARANHTGVQAISTVTGLQSELDLKANDTDLTIHVNDTANPHEVTKTQVGMGNVDNTSDLNKPISTATQTALDEKQPIATVLTNTTASFTTAQETKLSGIETGAEVNNISDANVIDLTDGGDTSLHTHDSRYYTESETNTLLNNKINILEKASNNGVATLDAGGKIPANQLPSTVMEFKGTWNASTNTPTLANGTGDTGDVYLTSTEGTVDFGAGNITFAIGDWVVYSGSIWEKSTNSNAVVSVNGQQGVVVLDTDDITEATNLYYTEGRVSTNSDVSANTSARHDALSVTDSAEIDFTLTGQDLTASLKAGSIDVLKLDAGVQSSLDLADSALQSETQTLQNVTDLGSTTTNPIEAQSFITTGGTSSDFVKGDGSLGSVDLSGYVPYTGATTDVDLGVNNLTTTGNVGIGILSPTALLHTYSSGTANIGLKVENRNSSADSFRTAYQADGDHNFRISNVGHVSINRNSTGATASDTAMLSLAGSLDTSGVGIPAGISMALNLYGNGSGAQRSAMTGFLAVYGGTYPVTANNFDLRIYNTSNATYGSWGNYNPVLASARYLTRTGSGGVKTINGEMVGGQFTVMAGSDALFSGGNARMVGGQFYTNALAGSTVPFMAGIRVGNNIAGTVTNAYGLYLDSVTGASTGNYSIYSAGGTMYHSGNVGIGTTAPEQALHVNGNGIFGNRTSTATASPISLSLGGTFGNNTSGSINNLKFKLFESTTGNAYGIGFTANLMEIGAGNSAAPGSIAFFTGENEKMRISSTGNVGIGTNSPSARLHAISTTEQFRSGYDASNYWNATTGSTGTTTFNAVGSGSKFVFSDRVEVNDLIYSTRSVADDNGQIRLQNNNASGLSGVDFYNNAGVLQGGFGYGNASHSIYPDVVFFDSIETAPILFGVDGAIRLKVTTTGVLAGSGTINASAGFEVSSTTQGFLPPRMTTTQKNAVASPSVGLVVYDTTLNKLCVYTTAWETITSV